MLYEIEDMPQLITAGQKDMILIIGLQKEFCSITFFYDQKFHLVRRR